MKKLFAFILLLGFFTSSCEEAKLTTYDPYGDDTLVGFTEDNTFFNVEGESSDTLIEVNVSSLSDSSRTVIVAVDTEHEENTADPDHYSFNPEVTIPAGEHFGNLTFTGFSEGLEAGETVVLKIESITGGGSSGGAIHKVVMF